MNRMKYSLLVGFLALVGLSSCGPIYPLGIVEWTVEGEMEVVDVYPDFEYDKLTFKVSWNPGFDNELDVTLVTPQGGFIFEGGPMIDHCYFAEKYQDSSNRMVSIIECPDSHRGEYEIFVENIGYDDVNAKVDVIESYDNGRSITQYISTQSRMVVSGDQIRVLYDY